MAGLQFRLAERGDVAAVRDLLAEDALGATREDLTVEGLKRYQTAFDAIAASPDNELWLAISPAGDIVGTWQSTYIPYLSRGGNTRCLIEAVRVRGDQRGSGVGSEMMRFALDQARDRGCLLAQLTTDKTRKEAYNFYRRLGFEASHEGMKLAL